MSGMGAMSSMTGMGGAVAGQGAFAGAGAGPMYQQQQQQPSVGHYGAAASGMAGGVGEQTTVVINVRRHNTRPDFRSFVASLK
jgi:hypothetical protein